MSTPEPLPDPELFLTRRQRRTSLTLPADPSDEELARDWTLSEADKYQALRCRGEAQRRRFAAQLCALSAYGRFLACSDVVPVGIANHLAVQLKLDPASGPVGMRIIR